MTERQIRKMIEKGLKKAGLPVTVDTVTYVTRYIIRHTPNRGLNVEDLYELANIAIIEMWERSLTLH